MEKSSNVREGLEEAIDGGKDECMSRGRSGDGSNNGNGSKKGNGSGGGGDRAKRNYTRKSLQAQQQRSMKRKKVTTSKTPLFRTLNGLCAFSCIYLVLVLVDQAAVQGLH